MSTTKRPARRPRIEEKSPLRASKAIEAYAQTGSLSKAAEATGIARESVRALLLRNPQAFGEARERIARLALANSFDAYQRAGKHMKKCEDPYRLTLMGKIAGQGAMEVLEQMPAQTINFTVLQESARLISAAKSRLLELEVARPSNPRMIAGANGASSAGHSVT
jgi:hypothetical protein